jgi:hypothetical protein
LVIPVIRSIFCQFKKKFFKVIAAILINNVPVGDAKRLPPVLTVQIEPNIKRRVYQSEKIFVLGRYLF